MWWNILLEQFLILLGLFYLVPLGFANPFWCMKMVSQQSPLPMMDQKPMESLKLFGHVGPAFWSFLVRSRTNTI